MFLSLMLIRVSTGETGLVQLDGIIYSTRDYFQILLQYIATMITSLLLEVMIEINLSGIQKLKQ